MVNKIDISRKTVSATRILFAIILKEFHRSVTVYISDVLHDLVPFVQLKKPLKTPMDEGVLLISLQLY